MRALPLRVAGYVAVISAAIYASLAGFRTLADFDVWWQLTAGRWIWSHGHVPAQEMFSYTAKGAPWMYPAGSGALFYWIFAHGGPAALSLVAPLACTAIAVIALRYGGVVRAWTVALAAPLIAWRCAVRADLFTTLLTALFLAILWEEDQKQRARSTAVPPDNARPPDRATPPRILWTLPLLMLAWVNLHPGFVLGIAMLGAFTLLRPRWWIITATSIAATFVNPFGWRAYQAVLTQQQALAYQKGFIGEWARTPFSTGVVIDALNWRDPDSSFCWLLALSIVAIVAGLWRGQFWGALALAGSAAGALVYARFQGVFVITVAIIAPELLLAAVQRSSETRPTWPRIAFAALLTLFVGVRIADLATNRYYLSHGTIDSFGAGVSTWFPARAVRFVQEKHLPREMFSEYSLGGYVTFAAPDYPVFTDGRALPFGPGLMFFQMRLGQEGPTEPDWQSAMANWNIRTLLVSVSRYGGFSALPLKPFCGSNLFRLTYLDETAAVFVRSDSVPTQVPALDCRTAVLTPPAAGATAWDRYQFYANAAKLYYALERDAEAEQAFTQARAIFDGDPALHVDLGQLRHAQGRLQDAEREFRNAIQLRPTPSAWFALADLMAAEKRPHEAMEYFRESALRDARPQNAWAAVAENALAAQLPAVALDAADRSLAANPYQGDALELGRGFVARSLALRAAALMALQRAPEAIVPLETAIGISKNPRLSAGLRLALADAYRRAGRIADARRALEDAKRMGAQGEVVQQMQRDLGMAAN